MFGLHPGNVTLDASGVAAEVELAEISGSETYLHVRHGEMRLVAHLSGIHSHAFGERVPVALEGDRLFAFTAQRAASRPLRRREAEGQTWRESTSSSLLTATTAPCAIIVRAEPVHPYVGGR